MSTNEELRRQKAQAIDKIFTDPERRVKAHQYQNELNKELEKFDTPGERFAYCMAKIVDLNERAQELCDEAQDMLKRLKE